MGQPTKPPNKVGASRSQAWGENATCLHVDHSEGDMPKGTSITCQHSGYNCWVMQRRARDAPDC